jgi:transcriptional regulator with XRE-family HTH domain
MVLWLIMNEIQTRIAELQEKGWTLAALADELGITVNAVEKWKAGDRQPANSKAIYALIDEIANRKRIPKKKRYDVNRKTLLS